MSSPQDEKLQIVAFSTNESSQTPNDIINIFLGHQSHQVLKKSRQAIAFSTNIKNSSKTSKIMICSVLNLTREYTGITDVNCYIVFIDLENSDSLKKFLDIINYAKEYCQLTKKIFVLGMISGNEEDEIKINKSNITKAKSKKKNSNKNLNQNIMMNNIFNIGNNNIRNDLNFNLQNVKKEQIEEPSMNEIIEKAVEYSKEHSGSRLIQKKYEECTEEERDKILFILIILR